MGVFLTDLDPRARVKGSRDPLGAQGVWAALGRPLVGNLTTVTTSVRGFTTLLVGVHLAERATAEGRTDSGLDTFLMWEQLAAYARHRVHGERGFFGAQRVAARAAKGRVTLSPLPGEQILGNQKTYGLWGLYTSPARASGLLAPGTPPRLTMEATALVESTHLPVLERAWGRNATALIRLLVRDRAPLDLRRPDDRLAAVAAVVPPRLSAKEAEFYRRHLVEGGPHDTTGGRQARLAAVMAPLLDHEGWLSRPLVLRLARRAETAGSTDVATQLRRIAAAESVLAPATALFSYVLTRDGERLDQIGRDVAAAWGGPLDSVDAAASGALPADWTAIGRALARGAYEEALRLLLTRNADVMAQRGTALPWADATETGRLRVRFADEPADLPDGDVVRARWSFPYFLPSLRSVLGAVMQAS